MRENKSNFILLIDGHVQITNAATLKELISYDKDFAVPIMSRFGKLWSNFWGAIGNGKQQSCLTLT